MKNPAKAKFAAAVIVCAILAPAFSFSAGAQTMGEYGATMNAGAASAQSARTVTAAPNFSAIPAGNAPAADATHSETIREYDEPPATGPNHRQDAQGGGAHDNWERVK